MLNMIRESFAQWTGIGEERVFDVGKERRVYAIGDIHGRRDLLEQLLDMISADHEARSPVGEMRLILLGDLIDRGSDSAGVVEFVRSLATRYPDFVCLMGNHEEVFTLALDGNMTALQMFRRLGRETLLSYGLTEPMIDDGDDAALHCAMLDNVPKTHRAFMNALPSLLQIGDYLFVHAGIRPGVSLEKQDLRDIRWIRRPFLQSRKAHPFMVVHGHSITDEPDQRFNRIGIDTGAYASDRLTAIGLQGTERWFLNT